MTKHGYSVANPRIVWLAKAGGADRDRTDDLKLAKLALSQLSYGPPGQTIGISAACQAPARRPGFAGQ